jgi:hypothetical protein
MHRAANIAANNVFARVNGRTDMRYIVGKERELTHRRQFGTGQVRLTIR